MKKIFLLIAVILVSVLASCQTTDNTPKLKEVTFSNMVTSMVEGESFEVKYTKQDGVTATFKSSDSSVATVEDNVVTAVSAGNFTLTANFTLGSEFKKYQFEIEVIENEVEEYSITYNLDEGTFGEEVPTTYKEGDSFELPIPTKEGFEFLGWTSSLDSSEYITEVTSEQTGDLVFFANWEEIETVVYSEIKYNLAGGTNPKDAPNTYEEGKATTLPVPTKEGYEFLGWTLTSTSSSYIFILPSTQTGDVTLYAKWKAIVVYSDIAYELNGGTNPSDAPLSYEEGKATTLPTPTKEGYEFLGWTLTATSSSYITVLPSTQKGNVVLYANWEKESQAGDPFTITYELNGGSWSWSVGTVTDPAKGIDSVSNLPEIFMADFYSYLFENGLLNSPKVSSKLHVSTWAGFSTKYGDPVAWYNATSTGGYGAADGYSELFFDSVNGYEAIGGFLGTSPYKEKYANLTKHIIQLATSKYTMGTTATSFKGAVGFVLDGYFYGTQGLLATTNANAPTFNALRGTIPTPTQGYVGSTSSTNDYQILTGVVGTEVQLVAPVKQGYMFKGWYTNPECTGEKVTSVSNECTLYASWYDLSSPAPVYNINYVLDGGVNPSNAPSKFSFGTGVELVNPTKEGYTFIGWSIDLAGQELIETISPFTDHDVTLYANWVKRDENLYTITYNYSDGKLPTYNPTTIEQVAEYVFTSYYNWYQPSDDYETFKSKVIAQWKDKQAQGIYKFYKQGGQGVIDEEYFCNASENFEEWNEWFTVFDSLVTAANGQQNAWNSYVGILRLGQVLSGNPPVTWKADFNTTLCNATNISIPLVTEYKKGDSFDLIELVIDDGRTFLGWYDENGNKVEKITATTEGNIVLTARWSEATPVESFEITNEIDRILKLSEYQLEWLIGPSNATFKKVTFTSTNPSVLTVSETGLIEAISVGTAKILVTVHGNTDLNMELEIEVYVDPYIRGEFVTDSHVLVNESIQLKATLVGAPASDLVWISTNPNIANVSENGLVSGISEGLAEIVVYSASDSNISFTFYVTVLDSELSGILELLVNSNNSEIYRQDDLLIGIKIGSDGAYYSDILGSVSKLLFEDYTVNDQYYLSNPSNKSSLSSTGIEFITVHYAADMPYSASAMFNGGKNLASYNQSCNTSGNQASWHYSVGNDGIWACQNEAYGAWHAGASKTMVWNDSGLTVDQVGSDLYTTDVTLGTDGYFYIKGVKTAIKNTTGGTKLNGMGLGVKIEGNKVYIGGAYQNTSYGYISSTGGNNNSIGMETSVREGSDLWLTWQYTAQLCAKLLLKYNLPLNRLVGHHFFSGKWCPQPMLENDLEIWSEFVELTRQQMELYQNYENYTLSFSSSSQYLEDNGRVSELPDYPECVTYTVTYSDGTTTKTVTLSTILPGNLE